METLNFILIIYISVFPLFVWLKFTSLSRLIFQFQVYSFLVVTSDFQICIQLFCPGNLLGSNC